MKTSRFDTRAVPYPPPPRPSRRATGHEGVCISILPRRKRVDTVATAVPFTHTYAPRLAGGKSKRVKNVIDATIITIRIRICMYTKKNNDDEKRRRRDRYALSATHTDPRNCRLPTPYALDTTPIPGDIITILRTIPNRTERRMVRSCGFA